MILSIEVRLAAGNEVADVRKASRRGPPISFSKVEVAKLDRNQLLDDLMSF
jgi:hypothetical protein